VFSELLKHPRAIALSIGFHVVVIAIILINFHFSDSTNLVKQAELAKTVKAEIVDQQQLEAQINRKKREQEARRKRELEKLNKEKAAKAREAEKKRKIALEKKKIEEAKRLAEAKKKADKKKKEEAKRLAEKKKQADQKKKQQEAIEQAEQKRKQQEQLKKQQEAKKQEKLAEQKRLREEQLAREAEKKRLEAEKLKQEADKRRLAEEERKRRQQELAEKLRAEESQRRLNTLREAYILAIKQKIERNWRQPQGHTEMPDCEVRVIQGPGGIILEVSFGVCQGGDKTYRSSIENAVYKADPLPEPDDPSLFERELIILFNPS
jgi:colicin import membrane protein